MIFAKHILCAAVADDENEIDNMWLIRREQPYAECAHHERLLTTFVSSSMVERFDVHVTTVELKQVGFFGEVVGSVGKCSKCGKIYYWIPVMTEIEARREARKYDAYSNRRGV